MTVPRLPGPETRPTPTGLAEALRLLHNGASRKPTEADAPKLSALPMTAAARAALQLRRKAMRVSR